MEKQEDNCTVHDENVDQKNAELPGAACTVKTTNPQMQHEGQKTGETADKHQGKTI